MSLADVSRKTVEIVDRGSYVTPSGATVDIRAAIDAALRGTVLYRPYELAELSAHPGAEGAPPPRLSVTPETTAEAARRLVEAEGIPHVVALNFASAKNPGGGFLGGAKAQEEDLARCSALYACQLTQRGFYNANRAKPSMLYTDHIIYSPEVPFFRDEHHTLLEAPFLVSLITAPAPNAGEAARNGRGEARKVRATLDARAGHVLAVAAAHGHRCVVLGAWGCGVFRNEPRDVADAFALWLDHPRFRGAFDRIVFAVYERNDDRPTGRIFEERVMR